LEPNVFSRDGVEAMINPIGNNSDPPRTAEQTLDKWIETMTGTGIPSDFDIVIMNPPFTRRERIPDEISKLQKIVPEVKGKTGYWAYFVVSADKVLKEKAILAVVMPEEFFVGGAAKSVREHLLDKGYSIKYIVRSAVEVAFSEAAHYRDYLIIFSKGFQTEPLVVTILKKRLKDIADQISDLALKIKEFSSSNNQRLSLEELEALKISDAETILTRHIINLKPLVGFNTIKAHTLSLELLDRLKKMPTIGELDSSGLIRMRLYRPGQYKTKGVEKFAEKLFISRYGARSPNVTFLLDRIKGKSVILKLKRANIFFELPIDSLVLSLRTYSGVKHLDISNEEEFGIINPAPVKEHLLKLSGLIPRKKVEQASKDIQEAYNDFAGSILLTRRIRLTSPNAYWLAFYSDNAVLGSQLPTIQVRDVSQGKILALYLNSIVCLLQLISYAAETEGAWVSLDHKRVWSLLFLKE
jgi:hypothetical protein